MTDLEQEMALVREVLEAEKAGYDFSGVTDTALQEAFLRGEDLRELATPTPAAA